MRARLVRASRGWSRLGAMVVAASCVAGCNIGKVTSVVVTTPQTSCDASRRICGVTRLDKVQLEARGQGHCDVVRLYFGDGTFIDERDHDFDKGPWIASHHYEGWAGSKTISAEGVTNCVGGLAASAGRKGCQLRHEPARAIVGVFDDNDFFNQRLVGWQISISIDES